MAGTFVTPYDIANRALQMVGVPRITTFADSSRQAAEAGFLYDMSRRTELRRSVWTFATRRAIVRPNTSTTKVITWPAYAAGTTYAAGDVVRYNNMLYSSLAAANVGNTPGVGGFSPNWEVYYGPQVADTHSVSVTYFPGDLVISGGTLYRAVSPTGFSNQAPPNATYWMAPQGTAQTALFASGAIGFDPPGGATLRNIYRLPANFLRLAPQDPKKAAVARLGTTAGLNYNDWEIEAGHLVTSDTSGGLILRFVGDVQIVTAMEELFCEAVACRMAVQLNEVFTQRPDLLNSILGLYTRAIGEARAVTAIEGGTTEPDFGTPQPPEAQPAQRGR